MNMQQQSNQPPSVAQLLNEAYARTRRITADHVYVGQVLDTFAAEIEAREKQLGELRARISQLEGKTGAAETAD